MVIIYQLVYSPPFGCSLYLPFCCDTRPDTSDNYWGDFAFRHYLNANEQSCNCVNPYHLGEKEREKGWRYITVQIEPLMIRICCLEWVEFKPTTKEPHCVVIILLVVVGFGKRIDFERVISIAGLAFIFRWWVFYFPSQYFFLFVCLFAFDRRVFMQNNKNA